MDAIVVIAGSEGSLQALKRIIRAVPIDTMASIFVVLHAVKTPFDLVQVLRQETKVPVELAENGDVIDSGYIYVAPHDLHTTIAPDLIFVRKGKPVRGARPSADLLFQSAAVSYRERVLGIILSGSGIEGADGMKVIKSCGGVAYAQDPRETIVPTMPSAAISADHIDGALSADKLANLVVAFSTHLDRPQVRPQG